MKHFLIALALTLGVGGISVAEAVEPTHIEVAYGWKKIGPYTSYSKAYAKASYLKKKGYQAYVEKQNGRYWVIYR